MADIVGSMTIDSKKYMRFDDIYDIHEFEENAVVFKVNIDNAWDSYVFRMELENRNAQDPTKDMVYLAEDGTITVPVHLLVRGVLKFQGVFLRQDEQEDETVLNVVAKTNRIWQTVHESINADNVIVDVYSNVIAQMRGSLVATIEYDEQNEGLSTYNIDGRLIQTIGLNLNLGGLSYEITADVVAADVD